MLKVEGNLNRYTKQLSTITCRCECEYGLCGRGCVFVDYCAGVNVCENGGHCIESCDEGPDYFCNCTFGFTGKNCTEQVSLVLHLTVK